MTYTKEDLEKLQNIINEGIENFQQAAQQQYTNLHQRSDNLTHQANHQFKHQQKKAQNLLNVNNRRRNERNRVTGKNGVTRKA